MNEASLIKAKQLFQGFVARTGEGAFRHVKRTKFIEELRQRLEDPDIIDQNPTSLCGPASLLRAVLMDNAEMYTRYAIDLFEKGEATLGRIKVKPGVDCRAANPEAVSKGSKPMAGIDWMTLASLRDSENDVLDYDDLDDEAAGITMPEDLADWFEKVGYEDVRNVTSVLLTEGLTELTEALNLARSGMRVCLLIEADMIQKKRVDDFFANHWVMLEPDDSWGVLSQRITSISDWYQITDHYRTNYPTAPGSPAINWNAESSWSDATFGTPRGGAPAAHGADGPGFDADDNAVALTIWSWGQLYHTLDYNPDGIGRLTVPVFKKRFHGYVAARAGRTA